MTVRRQTFYTPLFVYMRSSSQPAIQLSAGVFCQMKLGACFKSLHKTKALTPSGRSRRFLCEQAESGVHVESKASGGSRFEIVAKARNRFAKRGKRKAEIVGLFVYSVKKSFVEFSSYGVTSAAVGAPSTQFTSHGPSMVMKATAPAATHASCTIRAGT